jgi:polar amino acid transport system substrate-binding protein
MSKGKWFILGAVALLAVVAMFALAACGDEAEEPAAEETALTGSAAERAVEILGREPTGLAKTIVDRGTVIVANDANYAPQSSIDEATGELVGFDVDVALRMGEILGLEVQFENPNWETIPAGLNQGRYDVSIGSMTITAERDKMIDFTEPYYFTSGQVFVKAGGPQITAKVKTYTTDADTFPDLRNGNLDFVMTAGPTGQQAILEGQDFEFSGTPLYYEDLAFSVAEGETDWVALLNYAVTTMHEDGSLTEMSKLWYNGLDLTVRE